MGNRYFLIRKPWGVKIFIERSNSSINDSLEYGNKLLIFGLFLIGLVVIFSYGVGNVSAASNTVYVNVTGGSDTYDGSSPVHTTGNIGPNADIKTGISHVNPGGTVKIAKGIYTGSNNHGITISKNLNINGQSKTSTIINAAQNEWIFYITSGNTVSISNLKFIQAKSGGGGSAIGNSGGSLTVNNCDFSGNTATGNGGTIGNSGSLTVTNSNFNGNTATGGGGGAIYNTAALPVTIRGCTFTDNTATGNGGAINNDNGNTINVTSCTFTDNTATNNGGAIFSNGILKVYNSTFTGNNANFGGAISNFKTFIASGSTFTGNSATSNGGAICTSGTIPATISSSTFSSNTATWGGAIYNDYSAVLTVTGSAFKGNTANNQGGAITNYGTSLTVISSNLTGNNGNLGGAIYNRGTANIQFNRIVGNFAITGNAIDNTGTIDVTNNWWGINTGPKTGDVVGTIFQSWLVLKLSSNPTTIPNNSHSTITANLKYDNFGNFAGSSFPNGIPVKFTTNLGTISQANTSNGIAQSTLKSGTTAGKATISAYLDNQKLQTAVIIKDTIPPKVSSTNPKNGATGISRTATISIKFTENIKKSTYYNSITVKNLTTGKTVTISKSISGTTLNIKTTATRTANTWYTITIPKSAIKDIAGNNLQANYTFKFKTGA